MARPLAVSTPVFAVAVNPQAVRCHERERPERGWLRVLEAESEHPKRTIRLTTGKEDFCIFRSAPAQPGAYGRWHIRQLRLGHVALVPEYRRYYPAGESVAHAAGMTNIDDLRTGGH